MSTFSGRVDRKSKPTYIGQGIILKWFVEHAEKMPLPLDGVLAILGHGLRCDIKDNAEIVEALLLHIASEIDRFPSKNIRAGKQNWISKVFTKHGVLRINIEGYDPLRDPVSPRMDKKKVITLRVDRAEKLQLNYPWKRRSPI